MEFDNQEISEERTSCKTDLVKRERLFGLPLAVEPTIDGGEAADLVHLARVVVRHADHELEEEL